MNATRTFAGLIPVLMIATWTSNALALDPETSTQVTATEFNSLTRDSLDADGVGYVGVDECIEAINDEDNNVTATFTTSVDLSQVQISGERLFNEAYYFSVDRDSTSNITCSDTTCEAVDDNDVTVGATNVKVLVPFKEITGLSEAADCQTGMLDKEFFIRITFENNTTANTLEEADVKFIIDTVRPTAPTSFVPTVTESTVAIDWVDAEPSEDRAGYRVYVSDSPIAGGQLPSESDVTLVGTINVAEESTITSGSIDRAFTPNSTVYISVATVDKAGNASPLLPSVTTTVLDTVDFWEAYKASGGDEEGGYCAQGNTDKPAGGPGWIALLGIAGLLVWRRRERA